MPYDVTNMNSVMDAWNKSAFNQARENEAQAAMAEQQKQLLASIPQNVVPQQEQASAVVTQQPTAPTRITQLAEQGAVPQKPTAQEYEMRAINYLMNKGYDYDEASQLMAPKIQMYRMQEAVDNRNKADALAAQLDQLPIDSDAYRTGALQLYRLDPQIGGLYMKDGIGRREMYMQNLNRQNKREDMQYNADFQLRNQLQRMQAQEAYRQQLVQNKISQLVGAGYSPQQATAMVLGVGGRANANIANGANNSGNVSKDDYKWATDTISGLQEKLDALKAENPNAQLSAQEQQLYGNAVMIRNLANQQRMARYGLGQNQQGQRQKINVGDYNQLKPMLQALVQKNGGKFDKNIAMLVRKYAGLDPNNNNPNEYLNEVFKNDYGFSG